MTRQFRVISAGIFVVRTAMNMMKSLSIFQTAALMIALTASMATASDNFLMTLDKTASVDAAVSYLQDTYDAIVSPSLSVC